MSTGNKVARTTVSADLRPDVTVEEIESTLAPFVRPGTEPEIVIRVISLDLEALGIKTLLNESLTAIGRDDRYKLAALTEDKLLYKGTVHYRNLRLIVLALASVGLAPAGKEEVAPDDLIERVDFNSSANGAVMYAALKRAGIHSLTALRTLDDDALNKIARGLPYFVRPLKLIPSPF